MLVFKKVLARCAVAIGAVAVSGAMLLATVTISASAATTQSHTYPPCTAHRVDECTQLPGNATAYRAHHAVTHGPAATQGRERS